MKLKYFELDKEEKQLLDEYEKGQWVPVKDRVQARKEAMLAAKNTLNKNKNINIRLSERDLHNLKTKAAREGLPYQTYAASVLHKAVSQ